MNLELRQQVAEALGWTEIAEHRVLVDSLQGHHPPSDSGVRIGPLPIPAYETDIAAAWELLEELRDADCDVALMSCGSAWCLQFLCAYTDMDVSAPAAICKAWLKYKLDTTPKP